MGFCWNDPFPLKDAHRELGDKLSLSLTLALENARAYGDERYVARTLQSAFFHVPRRVAGLEFGHLYHAAEGARVGGDFYDIIEPEPGRVGVLIGDVSGHGVGVSALASLVKSAMHVQALSAPSPRRILAATNELVVRSAIEERYASAFFGLLDVPTGAFSYCSAGHPQPVLARPGAAASMLPEAQMVLGVASNVPYANDRAQLEIGDLLLMYTDGLVEARSSSGEPYGYRRLLTAVESLSEEPASSIPESLFMDVFSFAEGHVVDDAAILAVRRSEESAALGQDRLALGVA
jgi:serine phosphatase RsbU (regulator of sigma subunit)